MLLTIQCLLRDNGKTVNKTVKTAQIVIIVLIAVVISYRFIFVSIYAKKNKYIFYYLSFIL
tara:strand:+ start:689 stop:871 length:183 start_codon:yes stop_codon:yes gene_type:complete